MDQTNFAEKEAGIEVKEFYFPKLGGSPAKVGGGVICKGHRLMASRWESVGAWKERRR